MLFYYREWSYTSVLYGQRRARQDGEARSDNQGHPVNTLVC